MQVLRDRATIARLEDLDLRMLIEWRIRQIEESVPWDAAILAACRTFPLAGRIAHRSWNLTV